MNYELAKELKAAAFPQNASEKYWLYDDEGQHLVDAGETHNYRWEVKFAAPTLEELIEECPNMYDLRKTAPARGSLKSRWIAEAWDYQMDNTSKPVQTIAPTPTAAVARLWLALNAKTA
jgi:hypothetical protein